MDLIKVTKRVYSGVAVCLTLDNVDEAAKWCGGEVITNGRPNNREVSLCFPIWRFVDSRPDYLYASIGEFLVKTDDGFSAMDEDLFGLNFMVVD